jgi:hypothetical protein
MGKRVAAGLVTMCLILAAVVTSALGSIEPDVVVQVSSILPRLSFEDTIRGAEVIVLGSVVELGEPVWSQPLDLDGRRTITTPVFLWVEDVVKGSVASGDTLEFRQLGGTIGKTTVLYGDACSISVGERVLVGLYRPGGETSAAADGELLPLLGKYTIDDNGHAQHCWNNEERAAVELVAAMRSVLSHP